MSESTIKLIALAKVFNEGGGTDVSDTTATAADVLAGKYFYNSSAEKTEGSITEQAAQTIHPSASDQTIASGKYLAGAQTIKGVLLTNLDAGNIKKDVVVKVGDSTDDDCVTSVTGTYEGGGGGGAAEKDVNFYDYDGTIVASYSSADFANLSALPANPTHTGLTAQGWNWSLSDAKTYVASYGKLNIGQMYITDDGKTRLYIRIEDVLRNVVPFYWSQTVANSVSIDWGDGSTAETFSGTGNLNTTHTYAAAGDYVIALTVSEGTLGLGNSSSNVSIFGSNQASQGFVYLGYLKKVEIGSKVTSIDKYTFKACSSLISITIPSNITKIDDNAFSGCYSLIGAIIPSNTTYIGSYSFYECSSFAFISMPKGVTNIEGYAFHACSSLINVTLPSNLAYIAANMFYNNYSLTSVTIPDSVTSIGNYAFNACYRIKKIAIPNSVTSIGESIFSTCKAIESITMPNNIKSIGNTFCSNCYSLKSITIPNNVTSIGSSSFSQCRSLTSITIPSNVTSIANSAFNGCYGVKEYHLLPTTPPNLANANAFNNIPSDCIIYVPSASLETYKTANNWSTYASKMVGE